MGSLKKRKQYLCREWIVTTVHIICNKEYCKAVVFFNSLHEAASKRTTEKSAPATESKKLSSVSGTALINKKSQQSLLLGAIKRKRSFSAAVFFFWVPTFFLYSLEISLLIMSTSLGESNLSTICRCFDVNKYMIVTISVAACWWHYWWARSLTFDCRLLVWLPIVYWWTGSLLIILLSMLIVMASGGMLTADRGIEQVHCWLYHRTCLLFVDYWYANRHLHFQHSLLIV